MIRMAAVVVMSAIALSSYAEGRYSDDFIASVFADRDQKIDSSEKPERLGQLEKMVSRAAKQCRNNLGKGDEAENIGNMVMFTQKEMAKKGIHVSHYELLDVLYGALGDVRKGWDCAAVLSMYMTARNGEASTHISAYKLVQGFRDNGYFAN